MKQTMLSQEEIAAIKAQEKAIEERAILQFNKKALCADNFAELYRTVTYLAFLVKKQKLKYKLMFPQQYVDNQPASEEARFISEINCTYYEAITECEAVASKYEEHIELYMENELIGSSNGKGFLNYLENRGL